MVYKNKKIIKDYYNDLAKKYWLKIPQRYGKNIITTFYDMREKSIVKRLVVVKKNDLVLDLCSGPGRWILEYYNRRATVLALDISSEVLRSSMEKLKTSNYDKEKIQFIIADAENTPFIDDAFNIINCFDAFPHFPNKEKALLEMKRTTKKQGIIVFEPSNMYSLIGVGIYIIRSFNKFLKRLNLKTPIWTTAWNEYDKISNIYEFVKLVELRIKYMRGVLIIPPFSIFTLNLFYKLEEKLDTSYGFNVLGSRIVFICKKL